MKLMKIGAPYLLICCLLLGALAGCTKQAPSEDAASETSQEKGNTVTPTVSVTPEAVDGLTFALKAVNIADIPDPKPMILNRKGLETVLRSQVTIGGKDLTAYVVDLPGRQEQTNPEKILYLYPKNHKPTDRPLYWRTNDPMQSYQQIDGVLYTCSMNEDLSSLIATPYQGDSGTLDFACGDRTVKETIVANCMLRSKGKSFTFNDLSGDSCTVPVGDYTSTYLTVDYDALKVSASDSRYRDAAQTEKKAMKTLKIERNQTLTLDFPGKPKVLFTKITNDKEFKPGDEIEMATVLVDPKMNMMVSRLYDTSQKETRDVKDRDGNVMQTYEVNKALVPTVRITRADGTVVAEGQMPFG